MAPSVFNVHVNTGVIKDVGTIWDNYYDKYAWDPDNQVYYWVGRFPNDKSSCVLDGDSDGMDDDWESNNGLDTEADDSNEDPDDEGRTNLEEYQQNTDPNVADSPSSPPSGFANVAWAFGYCHQCDCTEWEVSHIATNASSYIMEHSVSSSGPWTVYSTTSNSISYPHNGTNGRWFRIKASNAFGSIYGPATFKTGNWCDNCGGGGEEP